MPIAVNQLSPLVVSTLVLPTASGQTPVWDGSKYVPSIYFDSAPATKFQGYSISTSPPTASGQLLVWNPNQNQYIPQTPYVEELVGKPLRKAAPTASGVSLQWTGTEWASRFVGETLIADMVKTGNQTFTLNSWVAITGLSASFTIYSREAVKLIASIICVNNTTCTPAAGYQIDSAPIKYFGVHAQNAGWWHSFYLNRAIKGLSPGSHTVQLYFRTDSSTYIVAGDTDAYVAGFRPKSYFQITRIASEI